MFEEVKMERMTWREFEAKKDQVLILPVGATEQHGPHLPLCVDAVLAEQFACRLAQAVGGVVAPTLSYGYKSKPLSGGGPLFPGTIDLNGATLQQLASDLFDEFVRDGFTKIFIMNAHFENDPFLIEAMDLCSARYGDRVTLLLSNWWDPMPEELIARLFDEVPSPAGRSSTRRSPRPPSCSTSRPSLCGRSSSSIQRAPRPAPTSNTPSIKTPFPPPGSSRPRVPPRRKRGG